MNTVQKIAIIYILILAGAISGFIVAYNNLWPTQSINKLLRTDRKEIERITKDVPAHHLADRKSKVLKIKGNRLDYLGQRYLAVTSMFERRNGIALIDKHGQTVKLWRLNFKKYFPRRKKGNLRVDLHGTAVLPDASVVAVFEHEGIVRVDRCGKLIWKHPEAHHSVDITPRGTVWFPIRERKKYKSKTFRRPQGHIVDSLVEADLKTGKIIRTIRLFDLFFKNKLHPLLLAHGNNKPLSRSPDIMHLNDIEELTPQMAGAFPDFKAGDLMISMRNINTVMVLDPNTQKVKWYSLGPWLHQHDPDFQADGTITIYDNHHSAGWQFGQSRILRMNPITRDYTILHEETGWKTGIRGKHTMLSPTEILITDFTAGRVFAVNTNGDLLLQFGHKFDERQFFEITQAEIIPKGYFTDGFDCKK